MRVFLLFSCVLSKEENVVRWAAVRMLANVDRIVYCTAVENSSQAGVRT